MISEMKDSNVKWIGKVPKNWIVERLQWHMHEINDKNSPIKTSQILSLTNKLGVIPYEEKGDQGNKSKENYEEYKIAYPNTIVLNSMNVIIGSVGICSYFGCVSPVYYVFKENDGNNLEFINYIFQTTQFQKELRNYANGILEIRLRLSAKNILLRPVAFPPLSEQKNIVLYLNSKCSQINELISKHNQIIEKLDDYRKSIISKAVTNGIDKGVSTKKSKIDYTERVPKHWEMKRLKFVATYLGKGAGITKDDIRENGDTNCVRYGEIYSKYNNTFKNCYSKTNIDLVPSPQYFEYGDILFAGTGELIEEIGKNIAYLGKDKCLAGGDIIVLKHNQEPRYLNYLLNSIPIQNQKSCGKAKLKVVHISGSEIGNIKIYLPDITEQKQIADYLDKKYTVIDELIIKQKEAIDKLEEYKKTLIYNAVTGKMNIDGGEH